MNQEGLKAAGMMKSKRKALKSLTQEKVVSIGDYRSMRQGKSLRKIGVVTGDKTMFEGLHKQLNAQAELAIFDSKTSLETALKQGEWDGVLIDERHLHDEALNLCEKIKKTAKYEDLFVVIVSDKSTKDLVRVGYEKGCDEWITKVDDVAHLSRLLSHHMTQ